MGKTTCAAILALQSAGVRRTLLVTTDPASSLSAVLKLDVGLRPGPVRGAPGLFAAEVDASRAFERWLEPRRGVLAAIALRGTYLDEDDVARLLKLSLPGIDEVIGLLEIARMAGEARGFDAILVDTAPTGHTLRLLSSPALLGRVAALLDLLQSHHRAVVSALRGSYGEDAADELIAELQNEGAALSTMLRDPAKSEISWVTLPEPMALEETSDALDALRATGIAVRRLIVNRITPDWTASRSGAARKRQACEWCEGRRRFEARALAPMSRAFPAIRMVALPALTEEPRGVTALTAAGKLLAPFGAPAPAPAVTRVLRAPLNGWARHSPRRAGASRGARARPHLDRAVPRETLLGSARWLLFGGKGGVGKTTCAAAVALDLAMDRRVLLVSTDPAHSLGDVFGAAVGDEARRVPGGPATLRVREIDAAVEMARFRRKYVAAVDEAFGRITRSSGGDHAAFRDLIDLAPPGIDEVIAVAEIAEALADDATQDEVIVTDTAPTGHALRLLQTPAVLREWTQALMAILLKYHEIVGAGTLAALLVQLSKRLRRLQEILADPAKARFVIVTRAAALPVAESEALIAALRGLGIGVGAVIVNAMGAGVCARCRAHDGAEARHMATLHRAVHAAGGYAMIAAPAQVPPPHGASALQDWRTAWRAIS